MRSLAGELQESMFLLEHSEFRHKLPEYAGCAILKKGFRESYLGIRKNKVRLHRDLRALQKQVRNAAVLLRKAANELTEASSSCC